MATRLTKPRERAEPNSFDYEEPGYGTYQVCMLDDVEEAICAALVELVEDFSNCVKAYEVAKATDDPKYVGLNFARAYLQMRIDEVLPKGEDKGQFPGYVMGIDWARNPDKEGE